MDWPTCLDRCQVQTFFLGFVTWSRSHLKSDTPGPSVGVEDTPTSSFVFSGSGIGTGPGVIQDRYSPTMGRHRTNPLFNGHSGHIAPPPQSQFDMGPKSFVKSNQVVLPAVDVNLLAAVES